MNEKAIIRLVRSATLKINYAGHTILVDPVFADKGTLQSALGVYKSPRVHLVMPISEITEGVDMVLLTQLGGRWRTALGAAKGLYRERRVLPRQPRQKFPHDHARAQNS